MPVSARKLSRAVGVLGLCTLLIGCSGLLEDAVPADEAETPSQSREGMELVGTWEYRSHREINQDENAIQGQLIIENEDCSASAHWCQLTGRVDFPAPDPPTSATNSPRSTVSETSPRTGSRTPS